MHDTPTTARRRAILGGAALALLLAPGAHGAMPTLEADRLARLLDEARALDRLRSLIVARNGVPVVEEALHGPPLDRPVNIKSVSKSIIAALVGIAIDKGILEGTEQTLGSLLGGRIPKDADPRVRDITLGQLLSMQAGLERTSGPFYGRWVESRDWVRYVLTRPFVGEPGGGMLYSTGNSHLLSAILTRASKRSTLELAREWLGKPLDIQIPPWTRDPQGIYFGGNEMALSPRAMLRFGELFRQGGTLDGKEIVPAAWVKASWTQRANSFFTGDGYGYGWFITSVGPHPLYYAWGYGGQMIYVLPDLALTVVMTSDPNHPSGRDGFVRQLHGLLARDIVPAAEAA